MDGYTAMLVDEAAYNKMRIDYTAVMLGGVGSLESLLSEKYINRHLDGLGSVQDEMEQSCFILRADGGDQQCMLKLNMLLKWNV